MNRIEQWHQTPGTPYCKFVIADKPNVDEAMVQGRSVSAVSADHPLIFGRETSTGYQWQFIQNSYIGGDDDDEDDDDYDDDDD